MRDVFSGNGINIRAFILSVLCAALLLSAFSCAKKDGTVIWREVERTEYDYIEDHFYRGVTEYDKAGRICRISTFNEDGTSGGSETYIYNNDGTLGRVDTFDAHGQVVYRLNYIYEFYKNGNIKKQTVVQSSADGSETFLPDVINYDEYGNVIGAEGGRPSDLPDNSEEEGVEFTFDYEYDEFGNVIREVQYVVIPGSGDDPAEESSVAYVREYKWERVEM